MMSSAREELEQQLSAADRESDDLRLQLDSIREAVAIEVDRTWTSPWKSPETVDAKLRARLAGHGGYQALRVRQRELDQQRRSLTSEIEKGPADIEKGSGP
ncbi:MAG TPA: hypothetical protein VGR13_04865 [Actinomycetota bacterium]|nr:hypothetical protein [Actinomycetota bacterium]